MCGANGQFTHPIQDIFEARWGVGGAVRRMADDRWWMTFAGLRVTNGGVSSNHLTSAVMTHNIQAIFEGGGGGGRLMTSGGRLQDFKLSAL